MDKELNELEKRIKIYKTTRDELRHLPFVVLALKFNDIYVTVDHECELVANDVNSELKRNVDVYPTIVTSGNNDYWYSTFSSERKIPESFLEKYFVVNVRLVDLIDDCLKDKDIKGIAINHATEDHIHLDKKFLRAIKPHLIIEKDKSDKWL